MSRRIHIKCMQELAQVHAELALLRAQLKQAQEAATVEASRAGKAVQAAQAGTEAAAASGKPSKDPITDHLALPWPTTVH